MKRKVRRQEVDTLYILGAGSSRALTSISSRKNQFHRNTTPIDSDFLAHLDEFKHKIAWQKQAYDLINENWLDDSKLIDHGLEEAIIKRVAHYDMLSALYPDRLRRRCSNEEYIYYLSHLIADYLLKCKSNTSGDTKQFVNRIFPLRMDPSMYQNRIITFNYDLIIDRPLLDRGISKRKIYFDRIVRKQSDNIKRSTSERFTHPLILKLHGSLNWRCSREYFEQIINAEVNPNTKIPIWSNDTKCPSPDEDESPLIIPPVPNKPITKASLFRMLWTTALEYLYEAKNIVIVGYSCPDTDVLAQALFTQFRNKEVENIIVCDTDPTVFSKYHELIKGRVNANARWQYFYSFRDYIKYELTK